MDQNQPPSTDLNQPQPPSPPDLNQTEDKLHPGLMILSFCIPLAGAIIYFVKKDKEPKSAKSACTFALIGFAVAIVINILYTIMST